MAPPLSVILLLALWISTFKEIRNLSSVLANRKEMLSVANTQERYALLRDSELNADAFRLGMLGYHSLRSRGLVSNDSLLTIIDFSLPSSADRLFAINLYNNTLVCKSPVSHGRNSGDLYASHFSNRMQSHRSSLGFYITGDPYRGGQGYSLILHGVDTGYNDLSRARGIVMHGADYATRNYAGRYGRLGRSFGCPALPPEISKALINLIKNGSTLFCYYPDETYIRNSVILHPRTGRTITEHN